jgi:hypothetical protein
MVGILFSVSDEKILHEQVVGGEGNCSAEE